MQDKQKLHSGFGIAAFISSLLSPLFCIAAVLLFVIQAGHAGTPGSIALQEAVSGLVGDSGMLALLLLGVLMLPLALLLGVVGLMQKNRKKTFALAATAISSVLMLLPFIGLLLLSQNSV